jgi:predicted aldo/keto reductase-like oxidoreductase
MRDKQNRINRRNFLQTAGVAGIGSLLAGCRKKQQPPDNVDANLVKTSSKDQSAQVPRRKLGRTDAEIPVLSLGTFQVDVDNQILLRKTLEAGVNFWDTAYNYADGNSELGIGKFLTKNPNVRRSLFLVTKASDAVGAAQIEQRIQTSLKRIKTDYIDLYHGLHKCSDPGLLSDEIRQWAEDAKKRKLIKYFGLTTHQNTAQVLAAAAKCPWIDAVMFPYNFRFVQDAELQTAIDACHKAGIGLIAMKVMGKGQTVPTEAEQKLISQFHDRGFDESQARVKLVLEDRRFASACVGMNSIKILNSNIAAVLDKTELTVADRAALAEYAKATCSGYCAGCSRICHSVLPDTPCIADVMRCLMYYNSYGDHAEAKRLFAQIPSELRRKLPSLDCRLAEARCPQRLPISELVAEAVSKLA